MFCDKTEKESPEDFLFGLRARGVRPGLVPTRIALDMLGSPDRDMTIVQVAGSVGKGSCAAMIASVLRAAGIRTALFTSPHLVRFGERFQVDGVEASSEQIAGALDAIKEAIPWAADSALESPCPDARPLTFFEWATIIGCHLFRRAKVQVAVMEVGLGGRWDATTACHVDVCAITRLDLEHTDILGDTIEKIAFEKAGVLKPGIPAATISQAPEALEVLRRRAGGVGTSLYVLGEAAKFSACEEQNTFNYVGRNLSLSNLSLGLPGEHQLENASLAILICELLAEGMPSLEKQMESAVRKGLADAVIPGRVEQTLPGVWLDGSHTKASLMALVSFVRKRLPEGRACFVFSCLVEKPAEELLEILRPVAKSIILTSAGGDRARDPRELMPVVSGWGIPFALHERPGEAFQKAIGDCGCCHVIACGSLYLVGAIKGYLGGVSPHAGDPSTIGSVNRGSAPGQT